MQINSKSNNNFPIFSGLSARKLNGVVMNSNYDGIANEMKKIGEIENFKVFLLQNTNIGAKMVTDSFEKPEKHNGCWAQDFWGIVGKTLLACENSDKTQILAEKFGLVLNPFQLLTRNNLKVFEQSDYVDALYNIQMIEIDGKRNAVIPGSCGAILVPEEIFQNEFQTNLGILRDLLNKTHVKGGNYYVIENSTEDKEVLVGQNELKKFDINELSQLFGTDKIHIIPQADYHIDLFIRPLKDKKVLVADDKLMLKVLQDGLEKLKQVILSTPQEERAKFKDSYVAISTYIQCFEKILKANPYADTDSVDEVLQKAGYEVIKVPARIFEIYGEKGADSIEKFSLKNLHNYINAIVHINDNDETVYITNKSDIDEKLCLTDEIKELTGFSVEKAFLDAIQPYVDKVYFVSGETDSIPKLLSEYYGGIHCMCIEVPS